MTLSVLISIVWLAAGLAVWLASGHFVAVVMVAFIVRGVLGILGSVFGKA